MVFWRRTAKDSSRPPGSPELTARPTGPVGSIAAITMARDEGPMLARWREHYGALVGAEHCYIVDDHSTDGSTEGLPNVLRVPTFPDRFEPRRMRLLNGLADGLLALYDYVVFTDTDELLVVDPAHGPTLAAALSEWPLAAGVLGLNVVHLPDEAPLDLSRSILEQRSAAIFTPRMCKPSIRRRSVQWAVGSHGLSAPFEPHPGLYALHLKFADRDRLAEVAQARNAVADRAPRSTWGREPDDLVGVLDAAVASGAGVSLTEFDPSDVGLDLLIKLRNNAYQPPRISQLDSMKTGSLVAIPSRLRGRA